MKVFFRYHLKEFFYYFFVFTAIFSILISLIQGIIIIQKLIEFQPSFADALKIISVVFLSLLYFLIPFGAFLSVLFHFYRLSSENEVLAFLSLGFSLKDFVYPFLIFCLIITIFEFFATYYVTIKLSLLKESISKGFPEKKPVFIGKNECLYVQEVSLERGRNLFKRVFILKKEQRKSMLFLAKEGYMDNTKGFLTLIKGWGFSKKGKEYEVIKFGNYSFFLNYTKKLINFSYPIQGKSMKDLKKDLKANKKDKAYYKALTEYYYRILNAFIIFPLLFIAFFLGFILKAKQKVAVFFLGIFFYFLIFMAYNFFLSLGREGKVHPILSYLLFYSFCGVIVSLEYIFYKRKVT